MEMKKSGYAETTIEPTVNRLKTMSRYVNLNDPEGVKEYIAKKNCSNTFKESLVNAYDQYARINVIQWNKPLYKREDPMIKLPLEDRVKKSYLVVHSKMLSLSH